MPGGGSSSNSTKQQPLSSKAYVRQTAASLPLRPSQTSSDSLWKIFTRRERFIILCAICFVFIWTGFLVSFLGLESPVSTSASWYRSHNFTESRSVSAKHVSVHHTLHRSKTEANNHHMSAKREQGSVDDLRQRLPKDSRSHLSNATVESGGNIVSERYVPVPQVLARGVAGRKMSDTPALEGAAPGHIRCDLNVDDLAYWNDPQGHPDEGFVSPFAADSEKEKFLSFSPDGGGWNNIRMSLEVIFVLALVTNRTLVLPPEENMYLLHHNKKDPHQGFADFFPIHVPRFQKRVRTISTQEFLSRFQEQLPPFPDNTTEVIQRTLTHCVNHKKHPDSCYPLRDYLEIAGFNPQLNFFQCVVFDEDAYEHRGMNPMSQSRIDSVCGNRKQVFWTKDLNDPFLLHFPAHKKEYRLLAHFYNLLHFSDPKISHYTKRFVRDFLHYIDEIFCAAGKVIHRIHQEARDLGLPHDRVNSFSSIHCRRGELQYKQVKISGDEWYENTKDVWKPNEMLYIATDERNKTFFHTFSDNGHTLRFLDDYWSVAGLSEVNPNFIGMIDSIIASHGRAIALTWFSTFSAYINRLRGYLGKSMKDTWYSWLPRKTHMHTWNVENRSVFAYEWCDGWNGIDMDQFPNISVDKF